MPIHSCLRYGIAAFALALGIAPSAHAVCDTIWGTIGNPPQPRHWGPPWFVTNWFLPEAVDENGSLPPASIEDLELELEEFTDASYWHRFPFDYVVNQTPFSGTACQNGALPEKHELTYIAFGTQAEIETGDTVETGQLYVGGWDATFDAGLGGHPEPADEGTLVISGGNLKSWGCKCESTTEQPCTQITGTDCYERVGYRGTKGTIEQSGGYHDVANAISLGLGSSCLDPEDEEQICSHGIYRLDGGTLKAPSTDVGVQGRGEFHMTGGFYDSSLSQGSFFVGHAYAYPVAVGTTDVIAGHGIFTQSGGTLIQGVGFFVGFNEDDSGLGAYGDVEISGTADFNATTLRGGSGETYGGDGSILQTGGAVEVNWLLVLGEKAHSDVRYEIRGGSLTQISCCSSTTSLNGATVAKGVYVGYGGHGELTVVGDDSTIDIQGVYQQGADSQLTVRLDSDYVTPIEVGGAASFAPGARVKVELAPGYAAPELWSYVILTASQITGIENIELEAPNEHWVIATGPGTPPTLLYVMNTYWSGCGLLGIEPVFVIALLRAQRRWRTARIARRS